MKGLVASSLVLVFWGFNASARNECEPVYGGISYGIQCTLQEGSQRSSDIDYYNAGANSTQLSMQLQTSKYSAKIYRADYYRKFNGFQIEILNQRGEVLSRANVSDSHLPTACPIGPKLIVWRGKGASLVCSGLYKYYED